MRISTVQIYDSGLRNLQNSQSAVARTQAELTAGKRVLTAADDPTAATLALGLEQEMARGEQYTRNMDTAEHDLRQQESQLAAVENILFRLRELSVQSGNAAYSGSERAAIAAEFDQHAESLQSIYNTRLANGEYLFSGFQGTTRPFVERAGGVVEYQGDAGQRELQIAPTLDVVVRDDGRSLFVDIPAANNSFVTRVGASNTGTADINVGLIVDQAAYDAVFPDALLLNFDDPLGPGSFTVYQRDRGTGALTPLIQQTYTSGEAISVAGVEVRVAGAAASGDVFEIEASNQQSLLTTIERVALVLRSSPDTPAGEEALGRMVSETLANLVLAETHVFDARADIGSRLLKLDNARSDQEDLKLINRELVSDLTDVDYNEAVSRLSFQTFTLELTQKSLARVSGISLFDYL